MMIARDTALGMYWLHKEGILHLDLKPGNLLVSIIGNLAFGWNETCQSLIFLLPKSRF